MTPSLRPAFPGSTLQCRQQDQILRRSAAERDALAHLAARTFIPGSGQAFRSPIQPLGNVILSVLSRCQTEEGRSCLYFRGFRPWFERSTATTHWDPRTAAWAYDLEIPFAPGRSSLGIPASDRILGRVALDLHACLLHNRHRLYMLQGYPVLPPTLLAHPQGAAIHPEATPLVLRRAEIDDISWREAWHLLRAQLHVPQELAPRGLELIDTRLVTSFLFVQHHRGSEGLYLDLREFLGRPAFNPFSKHRLACISSPVQLLTQARTYLPGPVQALCQDADLLEALRKPASPLILRGLCSIQVWVPPQTAANAFTFRDFGLRADLYHVPAQRMRQLHLPPLEAHPTSLPAVKFPVSQVA